MALPDFSKFKAPYRFVPEAGGFRLYKDGARTGTTFRSMQDAKRKVLALNDKWRASPAGRKASPRKKYNAQGKVVSGAPRTSRARKNNPRMSANPASYRIETTAARNGDEGDVAAVLNGETVGSIVLLSSASEVNEWADEAGDFRFVGLPRGQGGWFEGIEIDQSLRGQGTGRSMVVDMLEAAREQGAKYVALDASPSAHGFWLRMGFEEWDYEGNAFYTIPMVKVF